MDNRPLFYGLGQNAGIDKTRQKFAGKTNCLLYYLDYF
jgi:hypothetical protein